ncbi:MAG: PAS domain S-box protein [Chloroflexi bacterium]|nr:PAS domain S-box protein [Chloroflexota bacterium]
MQVRTADLVESNTALHAEITNRKRLEIELQRRRKHFQQLVDLSPIGILTHVDGNIQFMNRAAQQMFGEGSGDSYLGKPILAVVHPSLHEEARKRIATLAAGRTPESFANIEERFLRHDGTLFDVELSAARIEADDAITIMVMFSDITERKRTEQALKDREDRMRQLVDLLPDGVVVHKDGIILFVNPAAPKLLHLSSPDEILGQPAIRFVHPNSRDTALKRIQHLLKTGTPSPIIEEVFVALDGTEFDVEVSAAPFCISQAHVTH